MENIAIDAIPLTILTGFLGACKTTLLNRILNGNHGLRVAVLVNDFGAINIDAGLVIGVENDVISLSNGCVCCTVRDDLVEAVIEIINRPEAPEYIILEASGVSDPASIAMTFADEDLQDRIRLDSVTCVLDADQVFAFPEYPDLMALKLRQIAFSDMIILNKVDLAGPEAVTKVRNWVNENFRRLRIVETNQCDVPLEILLSVGRYDATQVGINYKPSPEINCTTAKCQDEHHHDHSKTFHTWSFETDQPMSLEALKETARKLPGNIYRAKGFIYHSQDRARRAVLQVVGRRVNITIQDGWKEEEPRTRIVAIGAPDMFSSKEFQNLFESCMEKNLVIQ